MSLVYSSDVRCQAKRLLSFCYRRGAVGPYRRRQSIWLIDTDHGEIVVDDYEVIDFLTHVISSDDRLSHAWERVVRRTPASDADMDASCEAFAA
jgi:hypothetical protein